LYGNEEIVGEAIREKCVQGKINREEIIVVSKLWGIHHEQVEKVSWDSSRA
jgi:diketogulonate reductase-like aldo/keto reductase